MAKKYVAIFAIGQNTDLIGLRSGFESTFKNRGITYSDIFGKNKFLLIEKTGAPITQRSIRSFEKKIESYRAILLVSDQSAGSEICFYRLFLDPRYFTEINAFFISRLEKMLGKKVVFHGDVFFFTIDKKLRQNKESFKMLQIHLKSPLVDFVYTT